MDDAALLDSAPDFVSIGDMFKATPSEDGGKRYVYFEASTEGLDQQGEVILAKALGDSRDYFLKYGNLDVDHYTKIGPKLGIPNHASYEIGLPLEVRQSGGSTFVKSEIYSGEADIARKANEFWASLTQLSPPARWYPSVGGQSLNKAIEVDPKTKSRKVVIKQVRWFNIGMSKTPVNQHVGTCAAMPMGAFAKAMGADGQLDIAKAMSFGALDYGIQKVPSNYFEWREEISKSIRDGRAGTNPGADELVQFSCDAFGFGADQSAENVVRFLTDLNSGLKKGTQ